MTSECNCEEWTSDEYVCECWQCERCHEWIRKEFRVVWTTVSPPSSKGEKTIDVVCRSCRCRICSTRLDEEWIDDDWPRKRCPECFEDHLIDLLLQAKSLKGIYADLVDELGDQTIERLISLMESLIELIYTGDLEDERGCTHASRAIAVLLGLYGDERVVEPLISAVNRVYWRGRKDAAEALGFTGDERAIEPLISLLTDSNLYGGTPGVVGTREAAKQALVYIGESSVEPLIKTLGDDRLKYRPFQFRMYVIETLGEIGGDLAVEHLILLLEDPVAPVREAAKKALS